MLTVVLNASLVIGRDADNQIKFSTDNNIIFRFNGSDGVTMNSNGLSTTGDIITDNKIGTATDQEYINFGTSNEVNTFVNNTERLSVTSSGVDITGDLSVSGNLDVTGSIYPYFIHNIYDPSSQGSVYLTTSYADIFSNNLDGSFVAKQSTCCIELLSYGWGTNRWIYLRLVDSSNTEWSSGANKGGYGTGTRNTERLISYHDESDRQPVYQSWILTGLNIGTTYTVSPQSKSSTTSTYLVVGGSYPATILRGYYFDGGGA